MNLKIASFNVRAAARGGEGGGGGNPPSSGLEESCLEKKVTASSSSSSSSARRYGFRHLPRKFFDGFAAAVALATTLLLLSAATASSSTPKEMQPQPSLQEIESLKKYVSLLEKELDENSDEIQMLGKELRESLDQNQMLEKELDENSDEIQMLEKELREGCPNNQMMTTRIIEDDDVFPYEESDDEMLGGVKEEALIEEVLHDSKSGGSRTNGESTTTTTDSDSSGTITAVSEESSSWNSGYALNGRSGIALPRGRVEDEEEESSKNGGDGKRRPTTSSKPKLVTPMKKKVRSRSTTATQPHFKSWSNPTPLSVVDHHHHRGSMSSLLPRRTLKQNKNMGMDNIFEKSKSIKDDKKSKVNKKSKDDKKTNPPTNPPTGSIASYFKGKHWNNRPCNPEVHLKPSPGVNYSEFSLALTTFPYNRVISTVTTGAVVPDPVLNQQNLSSQVVSIGNGDFQYAQAVLTTDTRQLKIDQLDGIPDDLPKFTYSLGQIQNQENLEDVGSDIGPSSVVTISKYDKNNITGNWYPNTDSVTSYWTLVGYENGDIELCNKEIYDNIDAGTGCWTSYNSTENLLISLDSAISDMVYIPQEGVLVIMSFDGTLHVWNVEWTGGDINPVPNVTSEIGHFYYYENDGFSDDDDDNYGIPTNDVADLPRSMAALYIDEDNTFVYVCGQYNDTVSLSGNLMVYQLNTSCVDCDSIDGDGVLTPLSLGTTGNYDAPGVVNTDYCNQVIISEYGLFLIQFEMQVAFIPFKKFDYRTDLIPEVGLLGSSEPDVYLVYNKQRLLTSANESSSSGDTQVSSDDTKEYTYDTITSIAYSSNPNNILATKNVMTGEYQSSYKGGLIFIGKVMYTDAVLQTGNCFSGTLGDNGQARYGESCPGSLFMFDICTGNTNPFMENNIDGPVHGMNPDINMNVVAMNGQGGLTLYSVAEMPGIPVAAEIFTSQASTCVGSNGFWGKFLAITGLVIGVVGLVIAGAACPPCLAVIGVTFEAGSAIAVTGAAVATAGVVSGAAGVAVAYE